jgi:hypothetical protein
LAKNLDFTLKTCNTTTEKTNFNLRIIVTEDPDALDVTPDLSESLKVVQPPDRDRGLEDLIRECTREDNKSPLSKHSIAKKPDVKYKSQLIENFENKIMEEHLNVAVAKDIIFRSALGGVHYGYYELEDESQVVLPASVT